MFARSLRAETRSKTKEDLKRVNKSNGHVRSWEKKWIAVKDTSMLVFKWVPSLASDSGISKKNAFTRQASALTPACLNVSNGLLSSYSCSVKPIAEPSSCSVTSEENSSNTFGTVEPNDLISENNTMKIESSTALDAPQQEKINATDSQEVDTNLVTLKPDPSDDTDRSSEVTVESTSELRSLDTAASPSEQSTA